MAEYRDDGNNTPIADLPESLRLLVEREERPALKAVAGIELDLPGNIAQGEAWLAKQPAPTEGIASELLFKQAAWLFDYGLSPATILAMLAEHSPGYTEDDIAYRVGNGLKHRQNDVGARGGEGIIMAGVEEWIAKRETAENTEPNLRTDDEPDPYAAPRVTLRRGDEIADRAVNWLWPGWLARGKYEVFGGGKGAGKSTIAYDLGARLTIGGRWPDGSPVGVPLNFLVWSGEDDPDDTIMPRFKAAGGDPTRIYCVEDLIVGGQRRPFDPATDMRVLLEVAREIPDLGLILIDPVVSAVAGDSHKNAETRRGLQPLVDFAKDRGAALIGITHFTKGTQGRNPVERITGSLAFGALARVVFGAVKSDDPAAPRSFVRIASNIGPDGDGFEYTLEQQAVAGRDYKAQRVRWGAALQGDAMTLLNATEEREAAGIDTARGRAGLWLRQILTEAPGGQLAVSDLQAAASANSHVWKTIERAKADLPIKAVQNLGAQHGGWNWKWLADDELLFKPLW